MSSKRSTSAVSLIAAVVATPLLLAPAHSALADSEASNRAHVVTGIVKGDLHRGCYAKSVPAAHWGMQGVTKVYEVRSGKDRLIETHNWYAQRLYLRCRASAGGTLKGTLVRFGPWQRGRRASKTDLAIALYSSGRRLVRYSTLDLAGQPDNVRRSVSHFRIIRRVRGFKGGNSFRIELIDGRSLGLDLITGKLRQAG